MHQSFHSTEKFGGGNTFGCCHFYGIYAPWIEAALKKKDRINRKSNRARRSYMKFEENSETGKISAREKGYVNNK